MVGLFRGHLGKDSDLHLVFYEVARNLLFMIDT